ncbi:MAG: hypothetical protein M3O91_08820 [Chloroflexota bacterium]|nr:hypothetical protein [Chloroflexota bacterium]
MQQRYPTRERPLSARDYDLPVGWWGWNWDPPVPLSVTQILAAGNMDTRAAALCWLVLEHHGSLLIAAEQPHSGKTTTLTAFLDFLPNRTRRVFVRGWSETFDYLRHTDPHQTLLLANELSSHLPVYLWGPKAVRVFRTLRRGYAIGSTLHADTAEEATEQLVGELGVDPADLACVDLLMVMRIFAAPRRGLARRVISVHRMASGDGRPAVLPLLTRDDVSDRWDHDRAAEGELLVSRCGGEADAAQHELDRRDVFLQQLLRSRCWSIPETRAALAGFRGETVPHSMRGDPTE